MNDELMNDVVQIRTMVRADIPAVARIESTVSPEPWSVALFEGEFDVDPATRHWLVAETGDPHGAGPVIGFAGMMLVEASGEGHVMNVAIDSGARRRGIGRRLCRALFDHAAAEGFDALTLEVRASNQPAIELYRHLGFAPVGVRPGYYSNADRTREDGLIMWLHDNVERRRRDARAAPQFQNCGDQECRDQESRP